MLVLDRSVQHRLPELDGLLATVFAQQSPKRRLAVISADQVLRQEHPSVLDQKSHNGMILGDLAGQSLLKTKLQAPYLVLHLTYRHLNPAIALGLSPW